jgi:hypothetical protein
VRPFRNAAACLRQAGLPPLSRGNQRDELRIRRPPTREVPANVRRGF